MLFTEKTKCTKWNRELVCSFLWLYNFVSDFTFTFTVKTFGSIWYTDTHQVSILRLRVCVSVCVLWSTPPSFIKLLLTSIHSQSIWDFCLHHLDSLGCELLDFRTKTGTVLQSWFGFHYPCVCLFCVR